MAIHEHMTHFADQAVADWQPGEPLGDPGRPIPRLSVSWDETEKALAWNDKLAALLDDPRSAEVTGLVVGMWGHTYVAGTSDAAVEALVAAGDNGADAAHTFLAKAPLNGRGPLPDGDRLVVDGARGNGQNVTVPE